MAFIEPHGRRLIFRIVVVPAFSWRFSASWICCGMSLRKRFASLTHSSIEAGELAMVSDFRPAGRVMPNSAASMPPQHWPSTWKAVAQAQMIDQVVQLVDKELGVQKSAPLSGSRVELPQPS